MQTLNIASEVNVEVRYHGFPSAEDVDVLIVEVVGETGIGCQSNGDAVYIEAMAVAGLISWSPRGLVFDFRGFKYEWGDQIAQTIDAGSHKQTLDDSRLPTGIVVSDLCREGLTSLIESELTDEDPKDWLFNSLEDAIAKAQEDSADGTKWIWF